MNKPIIAGVLLAFALPAFPKTHKDDFDVPCSTLWTAIKDTVKNSGKYIIVSLDETDMSASYRIGSALTTERINSVALNPRADHCEMLTQTSFSGFGTNDAGDFKKRVEQSLAKIQAAPAAKPAAVN